MDDRLRHSSFKPMWRLPRAQRAASTSPGFHWHLDARCTRLLLFCGVVQDGDAIEVQNGQSAAVRYAAERAGVRVEVVCGGD